MRLERKMRMKGRMAKKKRKNNLQYKQDQKQGEMLDSIINFFNDRTKLWKIIILFSAFLFLVFSSFFIWHSFHQAGLHKNTNHPPVAAPDKQFPAKQTVGSTQCPDCVRRALDGVYTRPELANLAPVAVMIDNHPDARPQSGIEKAGLVYEAEVEGYYTRLMAVFSDENEVVKIGPVRSARPYFVDWANELNAVYAHCGGSPEALVNIEQKGIVDLNEIYSGRFFWRATDRSAPHNIYLSAKNFNKFLTDHKISQGDFYPGRIKTIYRQIFLQVPMRFRSIIRTLNLK